MNTTSDDSSTTDKEKSLKKYAATVYLCQVLAFAFAGLPLLIGLIINFMKKNEATGTWIESHFNWQVKTVWITLAGFAVSGLTFGIGIGFFILIPTILLLIYRIVVGWNALNSNKPIENKGFLEL
jgi:uncharacterized membrane protein